MENNKAKAIIEDEYVLKGLELAIEDFETFCKYAGVNIIQLKVCIERTKGQSIRKIAMKFKVPRSTVKNICNRCFNTEKSI